MTYVIYLRYSLLADLWENYDSLPAKINNKMVQQYEQSKHLKDGYCRTDYCNLKMCTQNIEGRQIDEKDRVAEW